MRKIKEISIIIFSFILFIPIRTNSQNEEIKKEILNHGEVIRNAFSEGDTEKIKLLHHPDVTKALGYKDLKIGRDEVIVGLKETLENYNLEFIENYIENILILDSIAIEQTRFSVKGISKHGGESFIFRGRTMVMYIKYDKSPTG